MDYIAVYIDGDDIYICDMGSSPVAKGLLVQAKLFRRVDTGGFKCELKKYRDNGYKVCVIASRNTIKDIYFYIYDILIAIIPRDSLYIHIDGLYKNMAWIDGNYTADNINSIDRIYKNRSSNDDLESCIIMNTLEICRKAGLQRTKGQNILYNKFNIVKYKTSKRLGNVELQYNEVKVLWGDEHKRKLAGYGYKMCLYKSKYMDNTDLRYTQNCLDDNISKEDIVYEGVTGATRKYGIHFDRKGLREELTDKDIEAGINVLWEKIKSNMASFIYEAYRNNILVLEFSCTKLLCVDSDKSRDSNSFKQDVDKVLESNGLSSYKKGSAVVI